MHIPAPATQLGYLVQFTHHKGAHTPYRPQTGAFLRARPADYHFRWTGAFPDGLHFAGRTGFAIQIAANSAAQGKAATSWHMPIMHSLLTKNQFNAQKTLNTSNKCEHCAKSRHSGFLPDFSASVVFLPGAVSLIYTARFMHRCISMIDGGGNTLNCVPSKLRSTHRFHRLQTSGGGDHLFQNPRE